MFERFTHQHVLIVLLLLVALASAADLLADLAAGVHSAHLVQEAIVLAMALGTFGWLLRQLLRSGSKIEALEAELEESRALAASQSGVLVATKRQLADLIEQQFRVWELTASEREVGLFLVKGFSLKEIALLRGTAEKTIRQQASSIYQKAGVSGRHTFSAWFLEAVM